MMAVGSGRILNRSLFWSIKYATLISIYKDVKNVSLPTIYSVSIYDSSNNIISTLQ